MLLAVRLCYKFVMWVACLLLQASELTGRFDITDLYLFNHLTPNGHYMGRTAQLSSRCSILCIYSTNIRTEYFKHAA